MNFAKLAKKMADEHLWCIISSVVNVSQLFVTEK